MKKRECMAYLTEKVHLNKKSAQGVWLYLKARNYDVLPVEKMDTIVRTLLKEAKLWI